MVVRGGRLGSARAPRRGRPHGCCGGDAPVRTPVRPPQPRCRHR